MITRRSMTAGLWLLLLLFYRAGQAEAAPPTEGEDEAEITFHRCCPKGFMYSRRQKKCIHEDDENFAFGRHEPLNPQIIPPFASTYYSTIYEYDEYNYPQYEDESEEDYLDPASSAAPTYAFHAEPSFPKCDPETQDLTYRHVTSNDILHTTFIIDDQNITQSPEPFILLDLLTTDPHYEYCLDYSMDGTVALFCDTKLSIVCDQRPCVSHCCDQGSVVSFEDGTCNVPIDLDSDLDVLHFGPDVAPESVKYFYMGEPDCPVHTYETFEMRADGHILAGGKAFNHTNGCVALYEGWDNNTSAYTYKFRARVCAPEDPYSEGHLKWVQIVDLTVVPILFLVSLVFLGLLFIYIYMKNRHKLFGVMTLHLTAMLVFFYVCLIVSKIGGSKLTKQRHGLCVALGLFMQYFYLSAIFWLNAMSYDIWSTFRRMRSQPDLHPPANGWLHKRFKWYALYSQGCPLIIVLVTLGMQLLPPDTPNIVHPGIGTGRCFLHQDLAMIFYLNIIIVVLLLVNMFLFLSSTWNLCCGVWADRSGDPSMRDQQKTRYVTVVKMFFAMGITWLLEAVAHLLDYTYGPENVKWVVLVFKIMNSLQGFIIFCCIFFDSARIAMLKKTLCGIEPPTRRISQMQTNSTTVADSERSRSASQHRLTSSARTISKLLLPGRKKSTNSRPPAASTDEAESMQLKRKLSKQDEDIESAGE